MKRDPLNWQRWQQTPEGLGALENLRALARDNRRIGEWSRHASQEHYTKSAPIARRARLRHALRAGLGRGLPRLREFDNLLWLRGAGFLAPRPLAALATWQSGRPIWQGLVTVRFPSGVPADAALGHGTQAQKRSICIALGSELARLHGSGFIHRDLFLRNILVVRNAAQPRIGLLDCWRGGPARTPSLAGNLLGRGAAYDLGCLFVHLPGLVSPKDEQALLQEYMRAREFPQQMAKRFLGRTQASRQVSAQREMARNRKDTTPIQETWSP